MNSESRKIFLELSEHDALQLIALINQEIGRTDKAWRPYWLRVVQDIRRGIEYASLNTFKPRSIFPDWSGE